MAKDEHVHDEDGKCCECGDVRHCCCDCPTFGAEDPDALKGHPWAEVYPSAIEIGDKKFSVTDVKEALEYAIGFYLAVHAKGSVTGLGQAVIKVFGISDTVLKEKMPDILKLAYGRR